MEATANALLDTIITILVINKSERVLYVQNIIILQQQLTSQETAHYVRKINSLILNAQVVLVTRLSLMFLEHANVPSESTMILETNKLELALIVATFLF